MPKLLLSRLRGLSRWCAGLYAWLLLSVLVPQSLAQLERLPPPIDAEEPTLWGTEKLAWSNGGYTGNAKVPPPSEQIEEFPMTVDAWRWQALPQGLIYRSYLAGTKEPRLASVWNQDKRIGNMWDLTLGGRVGLLRYGTSDPLFPKGWQLDMEGASILRLNLDHNRDLDAADFRAGFPLTFSFSRWEHKFAFYHMSSHVGDEYLVRHPSFQRINYSRDVLVYGTAFRPNPNWRIYGEVGWATYFDGGSLPWETQFGIEYSPMVPTNLRPRPFLATNCALRQDRNWSGNLVVQTGIQWCGFAGQRFRFGFEYYNGLSRQFEFFQQFEQQIGLGFWYDF